jgi:O-antigen/teichoic acid export membrane protein
MARLDNSQTIARNSFWYGLELLFGLFGAFFASVVVARVMGPERMGYFSYVLLLTNFTANIALFGLPGTVRKYMAEYLSRGEAGIAHAIYRSALLFQTVIAAAITAIALAVVFVWGDPEYHIISVLLILSMAPRMIGCIPSQANTAAESLRRNTIPSVIGAMFNVVFTLTAVWIGWGLVGVAIGYTGGAVIDTVLKLQGAARMLGPVPVGTISPELRQRLYTYSGQGLVLMVLNLWVWDKSDAVILKWINPDIRQVTFFNQAFNITERLLMFPNAFAGSLTATIMAQYGRGEEKLRGLTIAGGKYAFLIAVPLLVGVACVARPAVLTLYGDAYAPLIPVLAIASVMGISKAMMVPPTSLLQATENQGFLIWTGCACGVLDAALDFLLTPRYGAIGAAVANGTAQTAALIAIAWRVRHVLQVDLRLGDFGRIALSGASMAAVVVGLGYLIPGRLGLALAVVAGVLAWCVMLRLTGAIDRADRERFGNLSRSVPGRVRPVFMGLVNWLVGQASACGGL